MGTSPANLKKLFVSEKYKEKGIYTIKLYKNGQVRTTDQGQSVRMGQYVNTRP